ncbi:MAG TPA: hypothetical protein VLG69_02110 [Candidatus Andersenbacteria bacterium]|nr:hypothetical protein [Candidatus Andersenbacteria bacterium]
MKKTGQLTENYVTQTQWAEGMEMIKDFFGKLVSEMQSMQKSSDKRFDTLEHGLEEFRTEQRQINKEMNQKIEMNTNAISGLTQELREVKKLEFDIYDHEKRITKLEEVR